MPRSTSWSGRNTWPSSSSIEFSTVPVLAEGRQCIGPKSSYDRPTRRSGNLPPSGSFSSEASPPTRAIFASERRSPWLLGSLAVVVGLLGLAVPRAIRPIYVGWMVAAFPIGWVVSHLILALIFYGLFTPLAALFRLMGRDALHRKPRPGVDSYFVPKTTPVDPASYLRQY